MKALKEKKEDNSISLFSCIFIENNKDKCKIIYEKKGI